MFKRHKDQITAVIFWGKDDANSWLRSFPVTRKNWPLLFDERLQAKPAYWALLIRERCRSKSNVLPQRRASADIDGQTEEVWDPALLVPILKDGETDAKVKALWDKDHFYVTVDVLDKSANGNDSVELYIDSNNGKTTCYEADDKKYKFRRSGANKDKTANYKAKTLKAATGLKLSVPIRCC